MPELYEAKITIGNLTSFHMYTYILFIQAMTLVMMLLCTTEEVMAVFVAFSTDIVVTFVWSYLDLLRECTTNGCQPTMPMVVAVVVSQTTITNIGVVALIFVDGTCNDGMMTVRYPIYTTGIQTDNLKISIPPSK
jgi:hypothetical protein